MPGIGLALADCSLVCHVEGRINHQRQGPYRVATVDGLQAVGIDTGLAVRHVVPVIGFTFADGSFICKRIGRIDGQDQRADTVAALQRLQRVDILTGLGVSGIMPGIGLTLADRCFIRHVEGRINHQRQRPYRVATVDGLQAVGIDASLAVVMSVPAIGLTLADSSFVRKRVGRIDGQDQRADTVATLQRLQRVDILTGLGVSGIMPGIGLTLADRCFIRHVEGRINHQRQRPYRVATVDGLQAVGIDASLAVVMSVPAIGLTLADGSFIRKRISRIDGQRQLVDGVAARQGRQAVVVDTGGSIFVVVPEVGLALTDGSRLGEEVRRVVGHLQLVDTVATVYGLQAVVIDARGLDGAAVPFEGLTLAACLTLLVEVNRIVVQLQVAEAVAAVHCMQVHHILHLVGTGLTVPLVLIARADISGIIDRVHRIDGQAYLVNAVATVYGTEAVEIRACRLQIATMPFEQLALAGHGVLAVMVRRIDMQLQEADAVAAVSIEHGVHVLTFLGQRHAVPFILLALADGSRLGRSLYRQICHERIRIDDAIQTGNDTTNRIEIVPRYHQLLSAPFVGQFVVTYGITYPYVLDRHNGQMQRYNTVTTVHGLQGVIQVNRFIQFVTMPYIRQLCLCDSHVLIEVVGRIDRQVEVAEGVATIDGMKCLEMLTGLGIGAVVP